MPNPTAQRFAQALLDLYGHEGSFEVELGSAEEFDAVAKAFSEMGLQTSARARFCRLSVECSPRLGETAEPFGLRG